MAIKREDKAEHMKALLEAKIKDYVYKYAKLSNFVHSNMWYDKDEGGWHYEGGASRIVHAVEDREKCAFEIAKLLSWLRRYVCVSEIRDEKHNTSLRCYDFTESKRYLSSTRDEKLLSRKCIIDFKIEYVIEKTKTYHVSRERIELGWINEKLIERRIAFNDRTK